MTTTTNRNDLHRPSTIVPADYTHVMEYGREWVSYDPDEGKDEEWSNMDEACELYQQRGAFIHGEEAVDKAILRCDVCGARFKYGSLFRHCSGEVISLGHDCADNMGLAYDRTAADRIQQAAKAVRLAVLKRRERLQGLRKFVGDLRRTGGQEVLEALRVDHHITRDIRAKLVRTGAKWGLSPRQTDLLLKLKADSLKPAEKHVALPMADGERYRVEGTVVSLKAKDSMYGTVLKMTVKVETPDGSWLVWGTAPDALLSAAHDAENAEREAFFESEAWKSCPQEQMDQMARDFRDSQQGLKGRRVAFTARVSHGSEEHFGFFKRPTKPELL